MKFQNHVGLDIGENTIKLVQLSRDGVKFKLESIGIMESVPWENSPEAEKAFASGLKKLFSETRPSSKSVVLSLPESQVYTRIVEMPYLEEPELSSAIRWQAEQYIPIPLSDVTIKHQILSLPETKVPDAKMSVLLVAAPTELVSKYVSVVSKAGLEAIAVETEIFAVARSLVSLDEVSPPTLLVNLGVNSTTLAVLQQGDLVLTQSVTLGGNTFSRALSSGLNLDAAQAEEYKKGYGLLQDKLEGKVFSVLKPIADQLVVEIKKGVAYSETRPGSQPIKRVVLSGGNALIPGLLSYVAANLGLEVQRGNPFINVNLNDQQRQAVFEAGPMFAAAVGLAMKMT